MNYYLMNISLFFVKNGYSLNDFSFSFLGFIILKERELIEEPWKRNKNPKDVDGSSKKKKTTDY